MMIGVVAMGRNIRKKGFRKVMFMFLPSSHVVQKTMINFFPTVD